METQESITPPADPFPRCARLKPRWWGWLLLTFVVIDVLMALLLAGGFYLFRYAPDQYLKSAVSKEWAANNVQYVSFHQPDLFKSAQKRLRTKAFSPQGIRDPIPRLLLAHLFRTLGKHSAAIYFYNEVLNISEENWLNRITMKPLANQARENLAILYYATGKHEDAFWAIDDLGALETSAENPELMNALRDRLEAPERADLRLKLAVLLREAWWLSLAAKEGEAALALGKNPAMVFKATQFLKHDIPRDARQLSALAQYYLKQGYHYRDHATKRALGAFNQVIVEKPDSEWAYLGLASIYNKLNQNDKAYQAAQKSVTLNPDSYYGYFLLGDLARKRQAYQEALSYFRTEVAVLEQYPVLDDDFDRINLENQIAYTYELSRDYTKALAHYQSAILASQADEADYEADYDFAREGEQRMRKQLGLGK